MLKQLHPDLWICDHPLRLMGVPFGTRTTIIRLPDGGLLLHSPGPIDRYRAAVEALGTVTAIVAPNMFHHLFVAENSAAFPEAVVYVAPGLSAKLKGPAWANNTLTNTAPEQWGGVLEPLLIRGMPKVNEVTFFHAASGTLLLTDLVFNFRKSQGFGLWGRIFLRLFGVWDRLGPSRFLKMMIKDKPEFSADVATLLAWEADRVVLCHGVIIETGATAALTQALSQTVTG